MFPDRPSEFLQPSSEVNPQVGILLPRQTTYGRGNMPSQSSLSYRFSCPFFSAFASLVPSKSSVRARLVLALAVFACVAGSAFAQSPVTILPGTTAVGQQAQAFITVTLANGGTVASAQAVMQGAPNLDFIYTSGGTCSTGTNYSAGQQCTVKIVFSPRFPGLRSGAVVLQDGAGNLLGATMIAANATGSLAVLVPGTINTVAGSGAWIYTGDNVAATAAPIFLPNGIAEDASGNLYLTDSNNSRIRRVDAKTGIISTVAGNGVPGYSGDNGAATLAMVNAPANLVLDGAGNIYFADTGNHAIRRVDAYSGIITTVAGLPTVQGYSGDGRAATAATLSEPEGLAFDAAGDLYIADTGNNVVREVSASTGIIQTIAGTGVAGYAGDGSAATGALLNSPWMLAISHDNSLYIADLNNHAVRKVNVSGFISTIAGNGTRGFSGDLGLASAAVLNAPASVVLDPAGNIYIADSGNNRVREISAVSNVINTISGTSSEQFAGDGGPANQASMYGPYALYFDQSGNLLLADMFHNRIREIGANAINLMYPTMRVNNVSDPQIEGLANDGNADLTLPPFTLVSAQLDPATTTCNAGTAVPSANSCNLGVDFAPTIVGQSISGTGTVNSNAGNSPNIINLSGQVLNVNPTKVALTSSSNPSALGAPVTFTATVTGGSTAATGTIVFDDGSVQLCSTPLNASAVATCTTSSLALGTHNITANYSGDNNNAPNVSSVLTQLVKYPVTLALSVAPNLSIVTASVTFTVSATAPAGTPTGAVTFYDGATALGSVNLNASGGATFSTTQLIPGSHSLSAKYAGDAADNIATSNVVSDTVQQATSVTTLATSNASITVGLSLTFTATVVSTDGPAPTGSVAFTDGTTPIGTVALNGSGTAALTLTSLAPGTHQIVAHYSSDIDNGPSSSSALTQIIQQIATTTAVTSNANPASAGGSLQLTAYVAIAAGATADGAIAGQVSFTDGSSVLGTASVDNTGHATINISTLSVGTHTVVATYAGNANYATSTSAGFTQQVQSTPTTSAISSSASSTLAGKPVTFTVTVTSMTGAPTGSVIFLNGSATLGQAALNAQGIATFTTTSLTVASHTITATYSGDPSYITSTSPSIQQTVSLGTTTLTLAGPTAPVDAGVQLTLTSTLSTNGAAPTGSLTLKDGSASIGSLTVSAAGSFNFTNSTLAVGTHTLTVAYAGDSNNAPSVSPSITVVIQQAPTITAIASSTNPSVVGQSVTLTSTITSDSPNTTGSVSFEDGGVIIATAPVTNGAATYTTSTLTFGPHTLTAVYSGDTNHAGSTSSALTEQIVQAPTAAVSSSANPSVSGTNVIFTAKVTGIGSIIPTGNITFSDGATALTTVSLDATGAATFRTATLSVASHTITVSYAGDKNYSTASATMIQTVQSANTQIALTASANPAIYGAPITFTATIASNGGIATGTVTFTDAGTAIGGGVLSPTGVATLTLSTLAPGAHTIIANYAGDGKAAASISVPLAISVQQSTTTALTSNANPAPTVTPIVLTATIANSGVAQATGVVTFTDGTTQLGAAAVDPTGHATLTVPSLAAGNHMLVASYAGDTTDFASVSPALTETVQLRATTTALTATETDPADPLQVTLISVVRWNGTTIPTGTITFTSGSLTIGSAQIDATGVATLTIDLPAASTQTVTAAYSGDAVYAASTSLATAITGGPATQFTLAVAPPSVSVPTGQHSTIALTLASVKGFTDTMQFGCLGLPYAATCTFSTPQATLTANGTLAVSVIIDTGDPLGAGPSATLRGTPGPSAGSKALLAFLPGSLLASLFFFRTRRRSLAGLLLLLGMISASAGITGCSGLQVNGTPAGTYTFKVSAVGVGTGATQSQTITLTVQ
jgi:large repetitive protein